jgi:glycosyltransferase involved in cell wall biosynthesis
VVEEHGFDVLVVPQVEASVIAWVATRGTGLGALVPHLHGNPRLEFEDGTRRTRAAFRVFQAVVARQVPVVLAVSPSLRDYAAATVAQHAKVVFAKNPVRQLEPVARSAAGDGRFRMVCVARLSVQKGQDILLRAVALARAELPPFQLTLVGQGDQEPALRALAHELGLDDVVVFAGYSAEPAHQLASADCFVLASRWEGFGVALVEALQAGLPLVAADCEFGPADIITSPVLGELAARDDPASLGAALVRAARRTWDPVEADQRRRAAEAYAPDVAVAGHFSILQSLRG